MQINSELKHSLAENSSIGAKLRHARQSRGLSQTEVAKALCLTNSIIDALENDNCHQLTAPVFVQGYLRNYAKLVQLTFEETQLPTTHEPSQPFKLPSKTTGFLQGLYFIGHWFLHFLNYGVFIGLLSLVFLWWHERHVAGENSALSVINMSLQKVPFPRNTTPQPMPIDDIVLLLLDQGSEGN